MSCFALTLEPLPSTDITEAVREAKDKCITLNLAYVYFNFNGVHVSVHKKANPDVAQRQLLDALKYKHTDIIIGSIK